MKKLTAEVTIDENGTWVFSGKDQIEVIIAFNYQIKCAKREGRQQLVEELINSAVAFGKKYA